MAGGKGTRLLPLTIDIPKPLLKVGDKPIMEHKVDQLSLYGIDDYWFSVKYLGEQIEHYFQDGKNKNLSIKYVWEETTWHNRSSYLKLKTSNMIKFLTNSDILTNLDYEQFYLDFIKKDADFSLINNSISCRYTLCCIRKIRIVI